MVDYDVIVIGAGAAGLAATKDLIARGHSVLCLEASGRIGGRIHTDHSIFGVPFDVGAHWLHNRSINPFVEVGQAMGLTLYPSPEIGFTHGDAPDGTALWDENEVMEEAMRKAHEAGRDVAASEVFDMSSPWALPAALMHVLPMGRDMHEISTRDWAEAEEGDNWFCTEGYGTLHSRFHETTPVQLNTVVQAVTATAQGVTVATEHARYTAKAAIVTASQGVLASEAIAFDPPLETHHLRAVDGITMGDYNHVALQFTPGTIPTEDDSWITYKLDEITRESIQGGGFLCNVAGSGLTVFETAGGYSRDLQDAGEDAAIEAALDKLVEIFGSDIRKSYLKGHATAYRLNPLFQGSYSGAVPGHAHTRQNLRTPHADRVFLAGEATHLSEQATVSGAHKEGLRASQDISQEILS